MPRLAVAFFLLFIFSLPLYSYAEDEFVPPLSALVQSDNKALVNSPDYLINLDESLKHSIRSPQEMWYEHNNRDLQDRIYQYFEQFEDWYLRELPLIILGKKHSIQSRDFFQAIPKEVADKAYFLFQYVPFDAQALIDLANDYNYTRPEKLNLFLAVFDRNISETELLKVMEAWDIVDHIAMYVQEYELYLADFLSQIPKEHREHVEQILRRFKGPITTVLHQVVKKSKITLFNKMMKVPHLNVNIGDYLLQTGLHEASNREWSKGGHYVISLLEHPRIDINARNVYGQAPIVFAVLNSESNSFVIVQKYLEYKDKLDLSTTDNNNRGLVLLASESGLPNLAKYLHKQGTPFPREVSLLNTYLTNEYRAVFFKYNFLLNVDHIQMLFFYQKNKLHFQEFEYYLLSEEGAISLLQDEKNSWANFKYYFLFRELSSIFNYEENLRYPFIMSSIYRDSTVLAHTVLDKNVSRVIAAIYNGDISTLKTFFSKKENKEKHLNEAILNYSYYVKDSWSKKVFGEFLLLDQVSKRFLAEAEALSVSFEIGTFLGEAIRANNVEAVTLLLDLGEDPTKDIKSITLRNAVIIAILNGVILYQYSDYYSKYLVILDKIMKHPSVTKDFLNKEVFPGINYADFAALQGNLIALRQIYRKGASVSKRVLWGSALPMEMISYQRDFVRQTVFLLEEKLKSGDKEERSTIDFLSICRRAFN